LFVVLSVTIMLVPLLYNFGVSSTARLNKLDRFAATKTTSIV
jgi:hypothetical protein